MRMKRKRKKRARRGKIWRVMAAWHQTAGKRQTMTTKKLTIKSAESLVRRINRNPCGLIESNGDINGHKIQKNIS
jgi:hypothetical protein